MVKFTILAGGYTTFIASYLFDSKSSTLNLLRKNPSGANPSWITPHSTNKSILYAVNENSLGAIQSFTVLPNGFLSGPVGHASSGGGGPAFTSSLSTGHVAIMNYDTGNGLIIPTKSDSEHFSTSARLITFPRPSGGVSHPHMALQHRDEIFVPDLGGDKIWRLGEDGAPGNWSIHGFIQHPKGSGPRHIAIHDNKLYTLHELTSTLTLQNIPPGPNGTTPLLANVSIIPPNHPAGSAFAAAEILIPPPTAKFPVPYIYVSNRNTGTQDPRGDTIAIFENINSTSQEPEGLRLVTQVYTGLDQIRGMEIGPVGNGGEEFLIAGGFAGTAGVVVFKRVDGGRGLQAVARNTAIPTRTSFVWL